MALEGVGEVLPPPLVGGAPVRGSDGFQARRIPGHRQRGQKFHRKRHRGAFERFPQVVESQPARPLGQRNVRRSARARPLVACAGRHRAFAFANPFDDDAGPGAAWTCRPALSSRRIVPASSGSPVSAAVSSCSAVEACGQRSPLPGVDALPNRGARVFGKGLPERFEGRWIEIADGCQRRQPDRLRARPVERDGRQPIQDRAVAPAREEHARQGYRAGRDAGVGVERRPQRRVERARDPPRPRALAARRHGPWGRAQARPTSATRLSTARAPITVSRAIAASRVTALSDVRSAASASIDAAEDFLMGTA